MLYKRRRIEPWDGVVRILYAYSMISEERYKSINRHKLVPKSYGLLVST